jgi:transcriptional regulator CtsR
MLNKRFSFLFGIASILLTELPVLGKNLPASTRNLVPCNSLNFIILNDGNCVDLTYLTDSGLVKFPSSSTSLVNQFKLALSQINVVVQDQSCHQKAGETLYGVYNRGTKKITMCKGSFKNHKKYLETLIHESWHAVQDCLDGMNNTDATALSEVQPELFTRILQETSFQDWNDVIALYPEEQKVSELEARFMENHPQVVLKALNMCARK